VIVVLNDSTGSDLLQPEFNILLGAGLLDMLVAKVSVVCFELSY